MIYAWRIERILLETTPWMEDPRVFMRAGGRRTFAEIDATDAFGRDLETDPHGPDYVLECSLLDEPPS